MVFGVVGVVVRLEDDGGMEMSVDAPVRVRTR